MTGSSVVLRQWWGVTVSALCLVSRGRGGCAGRSRRRHTGRETLADSAAEQSASCSASSRRRARRQIGPALGRHYGDGTRFRHGRDRGAVGASTTGGLPPTAR